MASPTLQPPEVDYSGEGRSDETIARRLILAADAIPGVSFAQGRRAAGISALDRSLAGLNVSARHRNPVLVLRDLDDDPRCASAVVRDLLPSRSPRCLVRICVREIEAWLMADRDAYRAFSEFTYRWSRKTRRNSRSEAFCSRMGHVRKKREARATPGGRSKGGRGVMASDGGTAWSVRRVGMGSGSRRRKRSLAFFIACPQQTPRGCRGRTGTG